MNKFSGLLASTTILCACLLGSNSSVFAAEEFVIATVDVTRVINSSNEAKKAKVSLEGETKAAKKLIEDKQNALKPLEEKAKKGEIKPGTPGGEEIKKKTRELVELMREKEDTLKKSYMKLNASLAEKTMKLVNEYAKEKDLSLVLDRGESTRSAVLYGESSFDITDEIISRFNK